MNLQRRNDDIAIGWNSWDTRSVLSQVLLPDGLTLRFGIREAADGYWLREALIGRRVDQTAMEQIVPGPRSYDGGYTSLEISWRGIRLKVETAAEGRELCVLLTPIELQRGTSHVVIEAGYLWNRPGMIEFDDAGLRAESPHGSIPIQILGAERDDLALPALHHYIALPLLGSQLAVSAGEARSVEQVVERIRHAALNHEQRDIGADSSGRARLATYGLGQDPGAREVYEAVQRVLAWDTIYEPSRLGVISPVSRIWNNIWGGYVLFCWDTYFAAYIAGIENRQLAYANLRAITSAITKAGFVPNFTGGPIASLDRSQPPVGSFVLLQLYDWYSDRGIIEELFDSLLRWNRWWAENRSTGFHDLLGWGSNWYEPLLGNELESLGVGSTEGAAYESGLDNSPMYDGVPFDPERGTMALADVGLNSLYVLDCTCLAELARAIDRNNEARELEARGIKYRRAVAMHLWDPGQGTFANRYTMGEMAFSSRISPTSFYPFFAGSATEDQVEQMISNYLLNHEHFYGEWMLPSISRQDTAYKDQLYWRGRIWAPMNFLVYLGLLRTEQSVARREVVRSSRELLLKEWRLYGHVHENQSSETGLGCDSARSDGFYHWGGLLGIVDLVERGVLPSPKFGDSI